MPYPRIRVSRLICERGESFFILETMDADKISSARQQRGYSSRSTATQSQPRIRVVEVVVRI